MTPRIREVGLILILITNSRATVDVLKKHGFNPVFLESSGAHTWINWRDYLGEFAPQLFR
jgi:enterochelin esterase family protein